jgi:hypothetical protein
VFDLGEGERWVEAEGVVATRVAWESDKGEGGGILEIQSSFTDMSYLNLCFFFSIDENMSFIIYDVNT